MNVEDNRQLPLHELQPEAEVCASQYSECTRKTMLGGEGGDGQGRTLDKAVVVFCL